MTERDAYISGYIRKISQLRKTAQVGTYTVRSGDTLSAIAKKLNLRQSDIARWSRLSNPNKLKPGQKLTISAPRTNAQPAQTAQITQPAAAPAAATAMPANGNSERGAYPGALNNPGNVRHYDNDTWYGELPEGRAHGQFARFDTPQNGLRAAARVVMNIANNRLSQPTIDGIAGIYAPTNENNTAAYAGNISAVSGIPRDAAIDTGNTGQMADIMRGIVRSENGRAPNGRTYDQWFTPQEYTNAVERARISIPSASRPAATSHPTAIKSSESTSVPKIVEIARPKSGPFADKSTYSDRTKFYRTIIRNRPMAFASRPAYTNTNGTVIAPNVGIYTPGKVWSNKDIRSGITAADKAGILQGTPVGQAVDETIAHNYSNPEIKSTGISQSIAQNIILPVAKGIKRTTETNPMQATDVRPNPGVMSKAWTQLIKFLKSTNWDV